MKPVAGSTATALPESAAVGAVVAHRDAPRDPRSPGSASVQDEEPLAGIENAWLPASTPAGSQNQTWPVTERPVGSGPPAP